MARSPACIVVIGWMLVCVVCPAQDGLAPRTGNAAKPGERITDPPTALAQENKPERTLRLETYRDKMRGAWLGQVIGVGWALPTEFKFPSQIVPDEKVPQWEARRIDQHFNDDIYFNMETLRLVDEVGIGLSQREAMIAWLNRAGRRAGATQQGRMGVAPPDFFHPRYQSKWRYANLHMDSDWAGIVAPGMAGRAADLVERYSFRGFETLYDGQFVAAMYAEAFFESDIRALLEAGLNVIPPDSQYAEAIRDVVRWHEENPQDWQATWRKVQKKYFEDPAFLHGLDKGLGTGDAKIHGAYVAMGLLYGGGDLANSVVITMRCGQDSDCSASNTGGVLGAALGERAIPARFLEALDLDKPFKNVGWSLRQTYEASERVARRVIMDAGGRVEGTSGSETLHIRDIGWKPGPYAKWWDTPPVGSRFSESEMRRIEVVALGWAMPQFLPGWEAENCESNSGYAWKRAGRENVVILEQKNNNAPAVLKREVAVPAQGPAIARLGAGGDETWRLEIRVEGRPVFAGEVGGRSEAFWTDVAVDLTPWRGRTVEFAIAGTAPQPPTPAGKNKRQRQAPPDMCLAGLENLAAPANPKPSWPQPPSEGRREQRGMPEGETCLHEQIQ